MKIKRVFTCCLFLLLSMSIFAKGYTKKDIAGMYHTMKLEKKLSFPAFQKGLEGYSQISNKKSHVITIVDFTKPSNEKRLYVLDLHRKKVLSSSLVAHGKGTGGVYAKYFSNKSGTYKSSNGFFLTGERYKGKNGISLRLHGLEKGRNNNAYRRTLVIHGAKYAEEAFLRKYGRLGRSKGCLAVPRRQNKEIIAQIEGGSVFYVHSAALNKRRFVFNK